MKSKMRKKLIAFMLCMVLVICNSVSILADAPAAATTATEKQVKETGTAKSEGESEEEKSADDEKDTSEQSDEESAPETETTEKKEETTEATTEDKEDATTEATTKAKEETTEATETSDKDQTTGEEDDSDKKDKTSETSEEETNKEKTTEAKDETAPSELTYTNDDVVITVSAVAEGAIPEGAELKVVPILKDDADTQVQYEEVEQKIQEKAAETETEIKGFLAYDITFVDADGNEIEPNSEVKVSMEYKEAALPAEITAEDAKTSEVSVMHLEEDDAGNVSKVVDMGEAGKVGTLETTDAKQVEKVEVKTESFSSFIIQWGDSYSVQVIYVDEQGRELTSNSFRTQRLKVNRNIWVELEQYAPKTVTIGEKKYNYTGAYLNSFDSGIEAEYLTRDNEGYWRSLKLNHSDKTKWNVQSYQERKVYLVYTRKGSPTPVDTVDSTTLGINMKMIDYESAAFSGAEWADSSDGRDVKKGILSNRILEMNQYPTFTGMYSKNPDRGTSLERYYGDNAVDANNLFLKSVYDEEGHYFYYNSGENAAIFNSDTKNFAVYKELMTSRKSEKEYGIDFFYKRGNFLPFNTFDDMIPSRLRNQFDVMGNALSPTSDRYNEILYLPDGYYTYNDVNNSGGGGVNFYFGMELSASFIQTQDGYYDGKPIRYEFTGDDDLWVYVDNALVLDMGGCHDARSGYIDFSTGEVWVQNEGYTTIRDMFEEAGIENVQWKEVSIPQGTHGYSKDNKGYIFEDFSRHTFKMWYMERGAGASNLRIKFNLPVIPEETVDVAKVVEDTEGTAVNYAEDVDFQFNIEVGGETLTDTEYTILEDGEQIGTGRTDTDGNFTLKHGQTARFSGIPADKTYKVKEIGAYLNGYKVYVNNTEVFVPSTGTTTTAVESKELSVANNPYVEFRNQVENTGTLTINKLLQEGSAEQLNNREFSILLRVNDKAYTQSYTVKENGKEEITKSAVEGKIILKGNQTAEIRGLPYGTSFEIEEEKSGSYYGTYQLTGQYYDALVPVYDEYGQIENRVFNVFGKVAGDCKVDITNRATQGGTTSVTVEKKWSDIPEKDQKDVNVTLYEGIADKGTPVNIAGNQNPITLNAENKWKGEWIDLPGDTNYYVQEEIDNAFQYKVDYSYTYEINGAFTWIQKCNNTYFSLGTNGIIAIYGGSNWLVWTSEKVNESAEKEIRDLLNNSDSGGKKLDENNTTFLSGNTAGALQGTEITFTYANGSLELDYDASHNWSFFGYGTYNKTIKATVTNSINEEATVDIPVKKIWNDNDNPNRPTSITVKLKAEVSGEEITLGNNLPTEIILNQSNEWNYVFEDYPYYYNQKKIDYSITETKIGDFAVEDGEVISGYISSVSGDYKTGFTVTNIKVNPWKIQKVSASNINLPLKTAKFTLTKKNEDTPCYNGESGENGYVTWFDISSGGVIQYIPDGVYKLEETKAPVGYQKSDVTWIIEIENFQVNSITDGEGNVINQYVPVTREVETTILYQYENEVLYSLPSAGGPGIYWYTLSGTLLMAGAALIVYRQKRKREVLLRK